MAGSDDYDAHDDPEWLRDELRQRDRRIVELKAEVNELNDVIRHFDEYVEDYNATLERWRETFGMALTDDGGWTWEPFWNEHWQLIDDWNDLVRRWNRAVPILNARRQEIGRPLGASDAQVATVAKLHKAGKSLRTIVDETNLSLRTVRTIIGRIERTDRTTKKRLQRIEIDKTKRAHLRVQKRTGDALPRQVATLIESGAELLKEIKGRGRGR